MKADQSAAEEYCNAQTIETSCARDFAKNYFLAGILHERERSRALVEALEIALGGCSNHGCRFAPNTSGMKTNSRCNCRNQIKQALHSYKGGGDE